MPNTGATFDVIIVGAGMAGCILAAKLAERGVNPRTGERLRIALFEAGPYLRGAARPGYGTIGCGATVATVAVFAAQRIIANHFSKT